jgi:hypothetical protein
MQSSLEKCPNFQNENKLLESRDHILIVSQNAIETLMEVASRTVGGRQISDLERLKNVEVRIELSMFLGKEFIERILIWKKRELAISPHFWDRICL